MLNNEFFEEQPQEAPQESEQSEQKIKVGDREFTQEELDRRIGLSDKAIEAETKYNRDIDKFWPEFTKGQQELTDLRNKVKEFDSFKQRLTGDDPQKDLKEQALTQAKALGLLTAEEARQIAREERQGERILEEIGRINDQAKETGKPKVSTEALLGYMQENGVGNPQIAYKLMFENELDAWKTEQLNKVKQDEFTTQTSSTAGGKEPPTERERLTRANFGERLNQYLKDKTGQGNQ